MDSYFISPSLTIGWQHFGNTDFTIYKKNKKKTLHLFLEYLAVKNNNIGMHCIMKTRCNGCSSIIVFFNNLISHYNNSLEQVISGQVMINHLHPKNKDKLFQYTFTFDHLIRSTHLPSLTESILIRAVFPFFSSSKC